MSLRTAGPRPGDRGLIAGALGVFTPRNASSATAPSRETHFFWALYLKREKRTDDILNGTPEGVTARRRSWAPKESESRILGVGGTNPSWKPGTWEELVLFVSSVAWLGITRPQASLPRGHPHPQSAKVEAHIFLGGDLKFFLLRSSRRGAVVNESD